MTDQEKIEQKVRLGVESELALADFAHERERVLGLADDLETWTRWLRTHAGKQPSAADFMPASSVEDATIHTQGKLQECLNYATLLRAEETLRIARQKVSNAELRKMQLSSPQGFQVKI